MIEVTHFTDPGCPWAYSAMPAHTTLRWRYGDQLRWTPVMIGLTEDAAQYEARGYTPTRSAVGYARFRRFGMPFQITPKARLSATSPGFNLASTYVFAGATWFANASVSAAGPSRWSHAGHTT